MTDRKIDLSRIEAQRGNYGNVEVSGSDGNRQRTATKEELEERAKELAEWLRDTFRDYCIADENGRFDLPGGGYRFNSHLHRFQREDLTRELDKVIAESREIAELLMKAKGAQGSVPK